MEKRSVRITGGTWALCFWLFMIALALTSALVIGHSRGVRHESEKSAEQWLRIERSAGFGPLSSVTVACDTISGDRYVFFNARAVAVVPGGCK